MYNIKHIIIIYLLREIRLNLKISIKVYNFLHESMIEIVLYDSLKLFFAYIKIMALEMWHPQWCIA